jgi:DNA-binding transcriptional ArsR family regulator
MFNRLEAVANTFQVLSDPTRLKILFVLAHGPRDVTSLTQQLKLPQPTVSHHLGLLHEAKAVTPARLGKHVFYSLGPDAQITGGSLQIGSVEITPKK